MLSLEGRAALVTGGAKRIGRAIALALGRAGAEVVVHYRNSAGEAEEVAAAIRNAGGTATTLAGDLAEAQGCVALFERALSQAGRMDILVNSASLFEESRLGSLTEAEVIRQLEVNTLAPLELSRRFAAHVRSRAGNGGPAWKGSIVNLLDSRIVDYDRSHLAYALSKRALFSLGRMMAIEFAPEVRVNAVAPGLILPPAGKDRIPCDRSARWRRSRRACSSWPGPSSSPARSCS